MHIAEDQDGEVTELTATTDPDPDAHGEVPSLAEQRTHRRKRRGLARDLQRPARKAGAA